MTLCPVPHLVLAPRGLGLATLCRRHCPFRRWPERQSCKSDGRLHSVPGALHTPQGPLLSFPGAWWPLRVPLDIAVCILLGDGNALCLFKLRVI